MSTAPPKLYAGMRRLIKADGTEFDLGVQPFSTSSIRKMIDADLFCIVNLRKHGLVMIVDDTGTLDEHTKPVNSKATALYHSICRPETTWPICGDVVIVPDKDFA